MALDIRKDFPYRISRPLFKRKHITPLQCPLGDLAVRTPGARMTPGGPREDILQTMRVRFLEIYEPVAAKFGMRIEDCSLRKSGSEIQFVVSLRAGKAIRTSDFIQDFLGPLAEKLIGCSWFDVKKGGVSGVFCRQQIKARLNYQPHQATIYGSLK
jgi:hypothetical protein